MVPVTVDELMPFASALAIGLLIGFERERSHRDKERQAFGARSFALLALAGAIAAALDAWVLVAGCVAVAALIIVGYSRTSDEDPGATTELAALVTYLLGALAYRDAGLAAPMAIAVLVVLTSKQRLHAFARDIVTDVELVDAVKVLVMAFVVFPLLPDRSVGPYGVLNPQRIWQLVLTLTIVSWVGYIAARAVGPKRGLALAGLAGGFVSASATTASMARLSRDRPDVGGPVAAAALASMATFVQLVVIVAIADRPLFVHLWPAVAAGAAVLAVTLVIAGRRARPPQGEASTPASEAGGRPFQLRPTLILTAVLTAAVLLGRWLVDTVGTSATIASAGAVGIADAHAGALAMATLHDGDQISTGVALWGIGAALAANTVVKVVVAFAGGGRRFGLRFAGMILPAFAVFFGVIAVTALA